MMMYYWLFTVFVLGAAMGSFLNVCVSRLPLEKSILWPGSRCGSCFQRIRWYDNLPLLSYLWLRGRCRTCGARFSPRYFLVELFTGLGFAALFYAEVVTNIHGWPGRGQDWNIAHGYYPWQWWAVWVAARRVRVSQSVGVRQEASGSNIRLTNGAMAGWAMIRRASAPPVRSSARSSRSANMTWSMRGGSAGEGDLRLIRPRARGCNRTVVTMKPWSLAGATFWSPSGPMVLTTAKLEKAIWRLGAARSGRVRWSSMACHTVVARGPRPARA